MSAEVEEAAILAVAACERWALDPERGFDTWRRSMAILSNALRLAGRGAELDVAFALVARCKSISDFERTLSGVGAWQEP